MIDAGKRKMIFRAGPIDMLEIDAHAKRIVLFGDHDDIGEPLGVVNLSDKLCCQEPSHFFANGLPFLDGGPSQMFLHRFCLRVDS